jgi:ATP-binding cassette subfamily B protein
MATIDLKNTLSDNRLLGLWRLLVGYRLTYMAAAGALGVAATARMVTFLLLGFFVDYVLLRDDVVRWLPWVGLGFLSLAAVEGAFSFLSGRWAAKTSEGIARRLRNYLFDHIQRLSFSYHDQTKTGELIQRATSDLDAVRRFFADQAIGLARIVLIFIINLVALLRLSWSLTLASIVIIPFVVLMSFFFFKKITAAYEDYQEQEAVLSTTLQENLTGVRVVKAFARQAHEIWKFDRDNWERFRRGRHLMTMHALYWPASDILCALQMLGGFVLAAWMAIEGRITVGDYLTYHGLVIWIIWPIRNLGRIVVQMSTGLVSYGRLAEIIREDREPLDEGMHTPDGKVRGEIAFDGVDFAYDGDMAVLEDISFRCEPGQAVALLGSTGSGKTSLVNLLPRFYDYTGGSLTLDDVELNAYPRHYLRQQIGIVEQEPFLFSRTIRENITYGVGRDVPDEEVYAAAQAAAIHEVILSFPEGYDTLVGERGVTLSGGQKQRVAIARTLLKDPRILILDDSTSSVDTETEGQIREALERLMVGRTTFIIAHRIQSVMNADLILVLDGGRIVQRGAHEALMAEGGIYRRTYEMQARIETELDEEMSRVGIRV